VLRRRSVRYVLAALAVCFLLFGAAGYFWLPGFAKVKLESLLSEEFGRTVRIAKIEVSPYTLSATVKGFAVSQAGQNQTAQGQTAQGQGEPLFAFDSLNVNISSLSLARGIPVVSAVTLKGPRLHLVRETSGRYNISDLIDKWTAGPSKPTPEFSVANISIEGGGVTFDDQVQKTRHTVSELSLGIPFLANTSGTVDSNVEPRFSAKVNGSLVNLAGTVRPFSAGKDTSVELRINDFDMLRAAQYVPDLPFQLESARLDARLNIGFTRQEGKDAVVRLAGESSLRDVSLKRSLPGGRTTRVRLGRADLRLDEATLTGALRCGLAVADLAVAKDNDKQPFLGFAALEARGVRVDVGERQASVEELKLAKPYGAVRRLADGELDIMAVLNGLAGSGPAPAKAAPPAAKTATAARGAKTAKTAKTAKVPAAWAWRVNRLAVAEGSLRYTDETLGKRVRPLTVDGLTLGLDGLSSAPGSSAKVDFSTRVNEQGRIAIAGTVQPSPLQAKLTVDLDQVNLVALHGWATKDLNAVLTRGDISAKGSLLAAGEDISFTGDVSLIDFSVLDKVNSANLLGWRSLKLANLAVGTAPLRLGVDEIAIGNLYARVMLTPEGRLNLQDVVKTEHPATSGPSKAVETPAAQPAPAKPAQTPKGPAPQIRIGGIVLTGGNINFADRFIKPNYTAKLTDLNGRIGALSAGTLTDVSVRGKVDRTAPLEISGKMDPLGAVLDLDIKAKATGIEMSGFTPYSGRYVGYVIEKGKLSVDVRYQVKNGQLEADNRIFLDQLTLGNKVESPNALSIPVGLVLALLKNSRGEIDINLPIKGSLNDPEFSLGGVIVKVLLNLVMKAATSPFTLLASLFGGGEELSYVAFEPGHSTLSAEAEKHLETLSKALRDRSGLKLELTGFVDPEAEQEGLKRARLEYRVKAQKATELARRGQASGNVADITLSAEEYQRYLERVYKAADIKKPRNLIGLTKSLPVEEMENLLLANSPTDSVGLERLAKDRGIAVQAWLVEKGGIDQGRVFLLAPKVGGESPKGAPAGGRVDFSLR